jgi:glucokinase
MPDLAIGIDIGGTGIKLGLVSTHGKLSMVRRLKTPLDTSAREVLAIVAKHAKDLLHLSGARRIIGVGIGCAGDVDSRRGVIRTSPNLNWHNVPLKKILSTHFRFPILVDNDANVAAWAAYCVEAKRRVKNLICITIGTGIGGGLVLDGKLYHGTTGTAGEIGHMTLFPNGVPCPCGNHGCTERYIGARAMAQEAERAMRSGKRTIIRKLSHDAYSPITPLLIQQAARTGDRLALQLWKQAGELLGVTLASAVNLLNPDWIVFAGGLSRAGSLILDPLKRTILKRSFHTPAKAVKLVISKLDQDLGMVGAGLLAHELFK